MCLRFHSDPDLRWFTLCRIPDCTWKKKKKSTGNLLVPIPSPTSPQSPSSIVAVGSNIYKFGGDVHVPSSSTVSVLDCKSHTWHQALSMHVDRNSSSSTASLVGGKIYVAGGCEDQSSVNWIQAFDPKSQTWSSVPSPCAKIRSGGSVNSLGFEGQFYLFGYDNDKSGIYNPKEGRWTPLEIFNDLFFSQLCVIDNVLFLLDNGRIFWYDSKDNLWRRLKGVINLPCHCFKMVDHGEKIVVLWEEYDVCHGNMLWGAEISFERRHGYGIWGKVEWFDVILTVPMLWKVFNLNAVSATV